MLKIILIFLVISSGSVFFAEYSGKRYGEILPLTCSIAIFLEYLSGVFLGTIKVGYCFFLCMAFALYILTILLLVKRKNYRQFLTNVFSPGAIVFFIVFAFFLYIDRGKYFTGWDEFSHWGDIARVFVRVDDFGTNPNAHSIFASYPPGMALFQYLFMETHSILTGELYCEWLAYFSYQIFVFSFFLPFIEQIKAKRIVFLVGFAIVILLLPLTFFNYYYSKVFIDAPLGILSGVGVLSLFIFDKSNKYKGILLTTLVAVIVLMKDAGLLFSIILSLGYLIEILLDNKKIRYKILGFAPLFSTFITKLLWSYEVGKSNIGVAFGNKVDLTVLIKTIVGENTDYRRDVWLRYWKHFSTSAFSLGRFYLKVTDLTVFCVLFLGMALLLIIAGNKLTIAKEKCIFSIVLVFIMSAIYVFGLVVTYMFKFSQHEALALASMERYLFILYVAMQTVIVVTVCLTLSEGKKITVIGIVLTIIAEILFIEPWTIRPQLSRLAVSASLDVRYEFNEFADEINRLADGTSGIFVVAQETYGEENLILRMLVKPNRVDEIYSVGIPFFDGDIWTVEMDEEELRELLVKDYDYVAIWKLNDYFCENYSDLFEDVSDIGERKIYRVNRKTGKLVVEN